MPDKLSAWPDIRERILEYIPRITESYLGLQKLSRSISGGHLRAIHAKASAEKDGVRVIVTRGRGTIDFWVRPVFSGDILKLISITSDKGFAPAQVCSDLISPLADMLRNETSVKVDVSIISR